MNISRQEFENLMKREYSGVEYNSRLVKKDGIFLALNGVNVKGSKYIEEAVKNGATLVLTDDIEYINKTNIPVVLIPQLRERLGEIFLKKYNLNLDKINIIGITGTNGKTTTTYILDHFLKNVTRIGTNEYKIGENIFPSQNTTPESIDLIKYLDESIKKNIQYFVMEASSHGFMMNRMNFIEFKYAIFTNLSQDHLDYHKNMNEYFNAKKKIFNQLKKGALISINFDNAYTKTLKEEFLHHSLEKGYRITTFSTKDKNADYYGKILKYTNNGMNIYIEDTKKGVSINCFTKLIGNHNLENILSTIPILIAEGYSLNEISQMIETISPVKGRAETVDNDRDIKIVIDYAHTDDGLKNICNTLNSIEHNRLIVVFGAGGNRDKNKRPIMGKVVDNIADYIILTSDNPRFEDPYQILKDIEKGISKTTYEMIEDRKTAIKRAIEISNENDIILIAGKGHEDYQIIGDKKIHFSDREEVEKILEDK